MDWANAIQLYIVLLISLTLHEAAHGLVAKLGGDRTAWDQGLVTANPAPHIRRSPFGMVVIPVFMLLMTGGKLCFAGASAPINPDWASRFPRRAALMSLAGPVTNLLLAAIGFAALYWIGRPDPSSGWEPTFHQVMSTMFWLNLLLAIFNLLPLPPFDGAGVVCGVFLPALRFYGYYVSFPLSSVISIVVAWRLLPYIFFPIYRWVGGFLTYPPSFG